MDFSVYTRFNDNGESLGRPAFAIASNLSFMDIQSLAFSLLFFLLCRIMENTEDYKDDLVFELKPS